MVICPNCKKECEPYISELDFCDDCLNKALHNLEKWDVMYNRIDERINLHKTNLSKLHPKIHEIGINGLSCKIAELEWVKKEMV